MDPKICIEASTEIRQRFVSLLDSLSGLSALTRIEVHAHSEEAMVEQILQILVEYQDLERCSFFALEDGRLFCVTGNSWADQLQVLSQDAAASPTEFRIGEGLIGIAAETGQIQFSADCANDPRFRRHPDDGMAPAAGSIICAPVCNNGEVLGVLNVSHPQAGFFHDWHRNMMVIFANVTGQMLGHNRLLDEMEKIIDQRTTELQAALREAESLKLRYEQLAIIDDLTNLHNRRFFFPESEAAIARAIRVREPFSLMLIDIDRFKEINDVHGHAAGDQVLVDFAAAVRQQLRMGDIMARFGGEEFVLALPDTDAEGAKLLATRIEDTISELAWEGKDGRFGISASIGIGSLVNYEQSADDALTDLLKQADESLYYCKSHGRNQHATYQDLKSA